MSLETKLLQTLTDCLDLLVQLDEVILNASAIDGRDVIMAIEDELDVEISDEEAEKLYTVKDILEFLIAKYPNYSERV